MTDTYDVIVIGGGSAGENAAQYAVEKTGLTCALIEAERVGGECSFWACMPSKALLRPLDVAGAANHLDGISSVTVQRDALLARRDTWRSDLDDSGQVEWAESLGIEVVRGRGRLAGQLRVDVESDAGVRHLRARHAVVLATGSEPVIPDDWAAVDPWTSRDATGVTEVPGSIAIIGGGVVACEAATWLNALGADVTLLVRGDRLLQRFEECASDAVAASLTEAGVRLRFGVTASEPERDAPDADRAVGRPHGGPVSVTIEGERVSFDEVLVATGRRPAAGDLGLAGVGLDPDDLDGRTRLADGLYAVGDVTGGPPLTHWGKYQARRVGEAIAARASGKDPGPVEPDDAVPVPQVVFTDPQVAQVGATAAEAADAGREVRVVDEEMSAAAGFGLLRDDASGHARLVIEGDRIIGATFVGAEVGELLHAATIAIVGRVPLATLRDAVPAYPTASEIWLRLVESAVRS
nr:NAD(P)/FAD-dependent oxidoreductase [Propioniciclava soli]